MNPLHSERVTIWWTKSRLRIIKPHNFDKDCFVITAYSNRYADMIEGFLTCTTRVGLENVRFQQNSATPHTAKTSINALRWFPGWLIYRGSDIA